MLIIDGHIRSFYVTAEQLQTLRYNVAKVLRSMQEVERHPIMKLAFDTEKREFDEHKREDEEEKI